MTTEAFDVIKLVLSALLGALLGTLTSVFVSGRSARLQTTLDLIKEWHSKDMNIARGVAAEAMSNTRDLEHAWSIVDGEESAKDAISTVAHYFEKMHLLMSFGETKDDLLRSAMSDNVIYWHTKIAGLPGQAKDRDKWKSVIERMDDLKRMMHGQRADGRWKKPE